MAEIEKVKLPNDNTIYDIKDAKAIRGLASGTTSGHVVQFGADGYTVSDSGKSMSDKQDTIDSSHKLSADLVDNSTPTFATATQGGKADTAVQIIKVNSASTGVTKTGDTVDITAIPASIVSAGALASGMTATTQSTSDDSTKVATTAFVHDVVDLLPSPMVYKGTLGTGGTKTTLPVDGTAEVGDTYKVITAGTYASQAAKVGDMFICLTKATSSNTWSYVPSGDDTDVTQVSAGTGLTTASGSPITTTGTIKAKLKSGTALAETATNSTTTGKSYAVNVDSDGDLACNVPWTDTTYNFEGTYDGTTNKAATMADIKDGKLTGYTVDSSKSTIGATTKVVDAIEQLDYRTQTNETNISLVDLYNAANFNVVIGTAYNPNKPNVNYVQYAIYRDVSANVEITANGYVYVKDTVSSLTVDTVGATVKTYTGGEHKGYVRISVPDEGSGTTCVGFVVLNGKYVYSNLCSTTYANVVAEHRLTANIDNISENNFDLYTSSSTNLPVNSDCFIRTTISLSDSSRTRLQEAFVVSTGVSYVRTMSNGVWNNWLQLTNQ